MRLIFIFLLFPCVVCAQTSVNPWDEDKIEVVEGEMTNTLIDADKIFDEGWSDLAHPNFWKKIMALSPDSLIINIASTREIIQVTSSAQWRKNTNAQKAKFRDSVRRAQNLPEGTRIYVTTGKSDFYKFDIVYPTISKGIEAFEKNDVDPWYAQAILLIESPGQLKKSTAGAYGPFQLMPSVARAQGLTVTKYKDERSDFSRSAYGASQLLKKICIPEAKKILDAHNLSYEEEDLWFRLFVLHVYHAGALNVKAVVNKIKPSEGNQALIVKMWNTSAAGFKNNSQNYTQLALASQLVLHDMVQNNSDYVFDCTISE